MDDELTVETPETPEVEFFGDPILDDDLSALDRGDEIEAEAPVDAVVSPEQTPEPEVPEADPPGEPEASGEPAAVEEPAAVPDDGEVAPEPAVQEEIQIPKSRLDFEINKRKQFESRLHELEAKVAAPAPEPEAPAFDVAGKIQAEYEAVMEGDLEKAAAIRMEVSAHTAAEQEKSIQKAAHNATTMTKDQLAFEDKVAELTEDFPIFDPDHAEFRPELLKDVLFKRDAYAQAGMNITDALEMATKEVAVMQGATPVSTTPVVETKESKEKLTPVEKKEIETSVKKKLDAAAAQPPDIQGESSAAHGERALNIEHMTEEEFDALPEATIKRYRGD